MVQSRKILLVNGHPDPSGDRFAAALCAAYLRGATAGGHQVRRVEVGALNLPPMRSMAEFAGPTSEDARRLQEQVAWAEHLVIVYPLWLGGPPAVLKAVFEQVFRYGFALEGQGLAMKGLLKGRSARVIVTMGMPALVFRLLFAAAGLRAVTRGILATCGVRPVRSTVIGPVEGAAPARLRRLRQAERLGRAAR